MKKLILSLMLAGAVSSAMAWDVYYNWSYLIDTKSAQDMASAVVITKDGKAVTFSHFGSKEAADEIVYGGEPVAAGSATSSTSDNRNLLIMKHDADGKATWAVSTREGYCDTANGNIAATSDGGVVALLKLRGSQNNDIIAPIFVDADGEKTLSTFNISDWIYNMVVLKISSTGVIEWIKPFDQSQLAVGLATKDILDGVTPYGLCVDSEDNIYIGGNYRTPIIAKGLKNSCYSLEPRNVATYSGDSQKAAGGMFLIKLDSDGNYVNHLQVKGDAERDQICGLDCSDDKIYFFGNAQGAENSVLTIGGKEVTLPGAFDNIVYGQLNNDLTANYVDVIKAYGAAADGGQTTQLKNIKVIDGSLYMLGSVKGGYGSAASTEPLISIAAANKNLEGFALKCNASDGVLKSGHMYGNFISAYQGVFKHEGVTYLYGYRMNAAEGVVLEAFSNDDAWTATEESGKMSIILGGGAPIAYGCAFDPAAKKVYVMARGNKAFTFHGTEAQSETPQGFGGIFASYGFDKPSEVSSAVANNFLVSGRKGEIVISTDHDTQVSVYNAAGIEVLNEEMEAGVKSISLSAGIYMVNGEKVMVK